MSNRKTPVEKGVARRKRIFDAQKLKQNRELLKRRKEQLGS